jgi:hypothetical protein
MLIIKECCLEDGLWNRLVLVDQAGAIMDPDPYEYELDLFLGALYLRFRLAPDLGCGGLISLCVADQRARIHASAPQCQSM